MGDQYKFELNDMFIELLNDRESDIQIEAVALISDLSPLLSSDVILKKLIPTLSSLVEHRNFKLRGTSCASSPSSEES
jgi:hypothetical protein